jgi:hypothetical protein
MYSNIQYFIYEKTFPLDQRVLGKQDKFPNSIKDMLYISLASDRYVKLAYAKKLAGCRTSLF